MEEIREAAMARYDNLPEDEKGEVKNLFTEMDSDGDGRVSLQEYLDYPENDTYDQEMFELVDKNGDGYLDFEEFKTFEFIFKVRGFYCCESCSCYLWGTYYACLTCYDAGINTFGYNLCCSCYRNKSFDHDHDHTDFRDNHRICQLRRPKPIQRNTTKSVNNVNPQKKNTTKPVNNANPQTVIKEGEREMEEMHEAAMAYYENMTEEQKKLARELYDASDTNGDGTVSLEEYLDFLKEQNFVENVPKNLFKLLDKNGNGTMDFEEFVTLHYMLKVRRGIINCDGCGGNLWGIYFLCVECYKAGGRTYNLCSKCYRKKKFKHDHATFLDNYALLDHMHLKRPTTKPTPTKGNTSRKDREGNTSKKGRSRPNNSKMDKAFQAATAAYSVGQAATSVATSMGYCAFM